jgi:hypothetical protein
MSSIASNFGESLELAPHFRRIKLLTPKVNSLAVVDGPLIPRASVKESGLAIVTPFGKPNSCKVKRPWPQE